jgi:4-aminobutyrate aminotransferase/(S)-3-amino-2-methylpropionate transaminase
LDQLFAMAPPELMEGLRRVCDQHGIALVADEVQTGFGRTGKMFAMEHYSVQPDLICVAKSLAGGFPLSGVIGRAAIMDAADPGGLGGTYAGNPLACVAALAVLDVFEDEKLLERSNAIGARLRARLESILTSNSSLPIAAIRGPGAMVAFDIIKERGGNEPDANATKRVVQRACELGLILLSCGVNANTIRILTPLTASDELIDEGLHLLEAALKA